MRIIYALIIEKKVYRNETTPLGNETFVLSNSCMFAFVSEMSDNDIKTKIRI